MLLKNLIKERKDRMFIIKGWRADMRTNFCSTLL